MAYPFLSDLIADLTGLQLPLPMPMFGLMVAASLLVGITLTIREVRSRFQRGEIGYAYRPPKKRLKTSGATAESATPPHELISELGIVVTLAGVVGARLFHILEYPEQFVTDPWGMLFSRGGLTIYGGLVFGILAGCWYGRRHKLPLLPMLDVVAPIIMLCYGIGRIGCQIAGDGDWGIPANMALKPEWLPVWLWAQTYENNIAGVLIAPPGVYPTPLYETLMALALFLPLWFLRRHPFLPGWLFSLYLLLAGIQRYSIEQIRVNAVYHWGSITMTQAEIISLALMTAGICGLAWFGRRRQAIVKEATAVEHQ